jgi:hypothetical protein
VVTESYSLDSQTFCVKLLWYYNGLEVVGCSRAADTYWWAQQYNQAKTILGCLVFFLICGSFRYRCRGVFHGGSHASQCDGFHDHFKVGGPTNQDFDS